MGKTRSKQEPSFEEALAELEKIVAEIDEGKVGLEETINRYEKGVKLIQHCQAVLARVETKIQQLQVGQGDQVNTSPFTPSESESSS